MPERITPPFTEESARQAVQYAEDIVSWNHAAGQPLHGLAGAGSGSQVGRGRLRVGDPGFSSGRVQIQRIHKVL